VTCEGRLSTRHERVDVNPSHQNRRSIWSCPLTMNRIHEMMATYASRSTDASLLRIHTGFSLFCNHKYSEQCDGLRAEKVVRFAFVRVQR
jgi:hypothetical protein